MATVRCWSCASTSVSTRRKRSWWRRSTTSCWCTLSTRKSPTPSRCTGSTTGSLCCRRAACPRTSSRRSARTACWRWTLRSSRRPCSRVKRWCRSRTTKLRFGEELRLPRPPNLTFDFLCLKQKTTNKQTNRNKQTIEIYTFVCYYPLAHGGWKDRASRGLLLRRVRTQAFSAIAI